MSKKNAKRVDEYRLESEEGLILEAKPIVCQDNGRTYASAMQLAHALNVYEESVLRHLRDETPELLGCKYYYK